MTYLNRLLNLQTKLIVRKQKLMNEIREETPNAIKNFETICKGIINCTNRYMKVWEKITTLPLTDEDKEKMILELKKQTKTTDNNIQALHNKIKEKDSENES